MLYVVNLHQPKATTSLRYWAVCCQSTGPEATPTPLHSSSILCSMLSTSTTPKPLHPFDAGLYVANLQGLKPPQSRYILLYTMLYVVNLHHPKATTSLLYWAVCCQSTGPEATPKPLHSSSILCCMLSTYTTPKPLHPFDAGLYVANLQGLKPPQSRYILLLYYAVNLHQPKATTSLLYRAVCCQPTGRENPAKAATFPFYTMLYVVNLHHPTATVSLLYWAVCCQPTGSEATPKPLHSSSTLCCMFSTYTIPKPMYPFYTGLYFANLQGLKPPQKPLHPFSILCCMLSTYTTPKPLYPFYTGLYVANLQGLKPPQSRYIPLLYYAVCCQPTGPETSPKATSIFYSMLYVFNLHQSHYIPSLPGCMLPTYRA